MLGSDPAQEDSCDNLQPPLFSQRHLARTTLKQAPHGSREAGLCL